jgi:hypothetical protein
VDAADYDQWKASFGSTSNLAADGNGDLVIDAADYVVWRDNLGRTWESLVGSAAIAGVPEPAGMALAGMAVAWALGFRVRNRRPS